MNEKAWAHFIAGLLCTAGSITAILLGGDPWLVAILAFWGGGGLGRADGEVNR